MRMKLWGNTSFRNPPATYIQFGITRSRVLDGAWDYLEVASLNLSRRSSRPQFDLERPESSAHARSLANLDFPSSRPSPQARTKPSLKFTGLSFHGSSFAKFPSIDRGYLPWQAPSFPSSPLHLFTVSTSSFHPALSVR